MFFMPSRDQFGDISLQLRKYRVELLNQIIEAENLNPLEDLGYIPNKTIIKLQNSPDFKASLFQVNKHYKSEEIKILS